MPKKIRVLSIGHSYVVGVNRRLPQMLQEIGGDRWEVMAAAPKYFQGYRDLRPVSLEIKPSESVPVEGLSAYNTGQIHTFWYGLSARRLLQQNWDLVHCWEEPYIFAGAQLAYWTPASTRFVFRTAQSLPKSYPWPFSWLERRTVQRCSGWICSGTTVEQNLLPRAGYADKPFARVPLGVDLERFAPDAAAKKAIRQQLGWNDDGPPILGYFGRFVPEKGMNVLMEVLAGLRTPWRAMLVGGGPMTPQLQGFAAQRPDQVRVLTNVHHDEMPAYLNAVDVMVLPSQTAPHWKEQFGRIIVEAFACGVPVIGSDSGEIPYVIRASGRIVPEADVNAWQTALSEVLTNPKQRQHYAEAGLARCPEFSWSTVARQMLDFFEQILDIPTDTAMTLTIPSRSNS